MKNGTSIQTNKKKPYQIVDDLTYDSVTGKQVVLDPNGPSEDNPSGWTFGGPNTGSGAGGVLMGGAITSQLDSPAPGPADVIAIGFVITAVVVYVIHEGPHQLPLDPNIYARKRDLELIDHIADKFGIPRDVLSDEVHETKRKSGRGGADNLGKKKIEEIAKEIKDRLGGGDN